jgi:glycosyltransferase involved in cell wall biosynthesis
MHPGQTVTVVLPAYNCEQTIERALRSVLIQDHPGTDIVVVDDGSTDHTRQVVAGFGPPVRLIEQAHAGAPTARNRAFAEGRGEFIMLLDSDDEWLPGRIAKGLAPMLEDPAVGATFCRVYRDYPDGSRDIYGEAYEKSRIFPRVLWPSAYVQTSGVAFRRSVLEAIGHLDATLRSHDDLDLYVRLLEACLVVEIEEPLAIFHDTPGSLSKRWDRIHAEEDYYLLIDRALARCPERYVAHRDVIMADAHLHWGIYYLVKGNHARARMFLRRSLAVKPTLSTLALLLGAVLPHGPVKRGLRGLKHAVNRAARKDKAGRRAGGPGSG